MGKLEILGNVGSMQRLASLPTKERIVGALQRQEA
jgi:hypothetical protein